MRRTANRPSNPDPAARLLRLVLAAAAAGLGGCRSAAPQPPPAALRGVVGPVEYANARHVEDWLHHPVLGDPSFDAFEHARGNPVHRGAPPYEWPVNGFFFIDPVGGAWYVYVGEYVKGYQGGPPARCTLFRSTDKGQTWAGLGTVLADEPGAFDAAGIRPGSKPDVSVVYDPADRRYHMVYDWAKADLSDGGIAHAWADKPEGPFHRDAEPILRQSGRAKLIGRYNRPYAATLLRREKDWLILGMMDAPPRGWAMFAITAPSPSGPWTEPVLVRNVEGDAFHPPLMEFFPAFVHGGNVYAPATSVALNRDFQAVFEAPVEQAHDPSAWKLNRAGSVWHSEDVENEFYGIWGQTFSGQVDEAGMLHAMFPSRDRAGMGTVNVAQRPWATPLRPRGFYLGGHEGQTFGLLRQGFDEYKLNVRMRLTGRARVLWDYNAPLGPDKPASGATLHPASLTRHMGLELSGKAWTVVRVDENGRVTPLASGAKPPTTPRDKTGQAWAIEVRHRGGGQSVWLSGLQVWSQGPQEPPAAAKGATQPASTSPTTTPSPATGPAAAGDEPPPAGEEMPAAGEGEAAESAFDAGGPVMVSTPPGVGAVGLLLGADSHAYVDDFRVRGVPRSQEFAYLYTEALLDAAAEPGDWFEVRSADFRWGLGAVAKAAGARAKWSVRGRELSLYSPRGPEFGPVEVWVDGKLSDTIDLHAAKLEKSSLVWSSEVERGNHAVVLKSLKGLLPLDCLGAGD